MRLQLLHRRGTERRRRWLLLRKPHRLDCDKYGVFRIRSVWPCRGRRVSIDLRWLRSVQMFGTCSFPGSFSVFVWMQQLYRRSLEYSGGRPCSLLWISHHLASSSGYRNTIAPWHRRRSVGRRWGLSIGKRRIPRDLPVLQ